MNCAVQVTFESLRPIIVQAKHEDVHHCVLDAFAVATRLVKSQLGRKRGTRRGHWEVRHANHAA